MPAVLVALALALVVTAARVSVEPHARAVGDSADTGGPPDSGADSGVDSGADSAADSSADSAVDSGDSGDPERWGAAAWAREPGGCGCASTGAQEPLLGAGLVVAAFVAGRRRHEAQSAR